MSDGQRLQNRKRSARRLTLLALFSSNFVIALPNLLTGLLLIDISLTFDTSIGVMGQIQTASSVASFGFALLLGVLTLRFRHESLLIAGLLALGISASGSGLASDFNMMLASYSLAGLAFGVVLSITTALVADYFPLEKRPYAMGWIIAGGSLAYLVGAPVISFITGLGGWRWAFLGFVLPLTLLGILLAVKGLPSAPGNHQATMSKANYLEGFRAILADRSATACLTGVALSVAGFGGFLAYNSSFFRQRFLMPIDQVSLLVTLISLSFTVGSLISGRLVSRAGRKPTTTVAVFLAGIFMFSYLSLPTGPWLAASFATICCFFSGVRAAASTSLALEQLPSFRGTMMSANSAAASAGMAIGAGLGGLAIHLLDYEGLGAFVGVMSVAAAIVFYSLVADPLEQ